MSNASWIERRNESRRLKIEIREPEEKYRERLGPVEGDTLYNEPTHEMHCWSLCPVHLAGQAVK